MSWPFSSLDCRRASAALPALRELGGVRRRTRGYGEGRTAIASPVPTMNTVPGTQKYRYVLYCASVYCTVPGNPGYSGTRYSNARYLFGNVYPVPVQYIPKYSGQTKQAKVACCYFRYPVQKYFLCTVNTGLVVMTERVISSIVCYRSSV